jgi:hypothetical protein
MRIPAPHVPPIPKNRVNKSLVYKQTITTVAYVDDQCRIRFVRFERFAQVMDMPFGQLF